MTCARRRTARSSGSSLRGRRGSLRPRHRRARRATAPRPATCAWLPWAAAAIVARARSRRCVTLQRAVNRLTFGRWDEPYDVLADLGQRLEATVDVDRLLADVVAELRGLGLEDVVIRDERRPCDRRRSSTAEPVRRRRRSPLAAYGEAVGSLRYRAPRRRRCGRGTAGCSMTSPGTSAVCCTPAGSPDDLQRALERLVARSRGGTSPAPTRPARRTGPGAGRAPPAARRDRRQARRVLAVRRRRRRPARRAARDRPRGAAGRRGLRPPALDELGPGRGPGQVAHGSPLGTAIDGRPLGRRPAGSSGRDGGGGVSHRHRSRDEFGPARRRVGLSRRRSSADGRAASDHGRRRRPGDLRR